MDRYIYALADPNAPDAIRYVGRTNDLRMRHSRHRDWPLGQTVRDAWLTYLRIAGLSPVIHTLERCTADCEQQRERFWIEQHVAAGSDLVNAAAFWKRPDRQIVPPGVRVAWQVLHEVISRIAFSNTCGPADPVFHRITSYRAFVGIKALCEQYPGLRIAPLEYLEQGEL